MYHRMPLIFIACSGLFVLVHCLSCCLTPIVSRINPCMHFSGSSSQPSDFYKPQLLFLFLFHDDILHYLCSRTPPHACCSCSSACGSQHAVNNRHIRQHVRQHERLVQRCRMLKRGERSRDRIPDVRRYSHLPFYWRRARHCVELA